MVEIQTVLFSRELWSGLFGAVLGGGISLLGSWAATGRAFRQQRNLNADMERTHAAKLAFIAFFKLKNLYEDVANMERQINEMFSTADANGASEMEPFGKVMELVGDGERPEQITTEEVSFLVHEKNASLFQEIFLIQKRVLHLLASASVYNDLRHEFFKFCEEHSADVGLGSGTEMTNQFSGQSAVIARAKASRLNNLLGQIMEYLEREVEESWRVLEQLKDSAETHFGEKYPKLKLEKADKNGL